MALNSRKKGYSIRERAFNLQNSFDIWLSQKVSFTEEQLNQGKSILTLQTSGNVGGANQSGMAFGGRRELGGRDPKDIIRETS